jgi:tetratricopeptide (TPR) repeat protein
LHYGSILLAARKEMYDSIIVTSGQVRTYATGTHFEVSYIDHRIDVSVLEGSVKITSDGARETAVGPLEECIVSPEEAGVHLSRFGIEKKNRLISDFALMTTACTRFGFAGALPVKTGDTVLYRQDNYARHSLQRPSASDDSAAARQYGIARSMIAKGKYAAASHVLEDYIVKYRLNADSAWFDLAFCYTFLGRYGDAVTAYRRAAQESVDEPLIETALHRSNKIELLKRGRYDDAGRGIEEYLAKYPQGKWREEEWYYRVKVSIARGETDEADTLTRRYSAEYPHNCKVAELSAAVAALRHSGR